MARALSGTVKPVIDLAGQVPVDGYEVPDRLREAAHLRTPCDVFPYATNTGRRKERRPHRPRMSVPTTTDHQARPPCTTSA